MEVLRSDRHFQSQPNFKENNNSRVNLRRRGYLVEFSIVFSQHGLSMKPAFMIRASFCFMLLIIAALTKGCVSPENESEQPWSTPKSWEMGLPSGLKEGR